jgi:predicted nucleotidyltransferase
MVTREQIEAMSNHIAEAFQPQQIILFGSYAYGQPDATSDVDMLVIMPLQERGVWKALEMVQLVAPPFSVDLLVRDPQDIRQRLAWNDLFIREIMEKGIVLYAATDTMFA